MLEDIVKRIEERLAATGLSAKAASEAAGLSEDAIRNMQRKVRAGVRAGVSTRTLAALAPVLETDVQFLLRGGHVEEQSAFPGGIRWVRLEGEVRAGAFLEVSETSEPEELLPYADEQYDRAELFALRVAGRSMDLEYPDGSIVICVRAVQSGVCEGDHVVLRRRDITGKVETTLKEVVVNGSQVEFWPRSSDPRYQSPFVPPPANDHTDEEWEVVGVVISIYRKRSARRGAPISI